MYFNLATFFVVYIIVINSISVIETYPFQTSFCRSFQNVNVLLKDEEKVEFNRTVTGCLERTQFEDLTVTEAYIIEQKLPKLLIKDSIRHLTKLQTLSIRECDLDLVEPKAFRNVPSLKKIQISYCHLKEISKGVFNEISQLNELRIHNNQIDVIENEAFVNLTRLKKIYASNNLLEYWNREWFQGSPALEVIDFKSNKIRTIPRNAFVNLLNIRQIFFDYNEISKIQPDAFQGITKLDYLGLKYNRLTTIDDAVFPNPIQIKTLIITANYLNFLPNDMFKKVSVTDLGIDSNPWKCPCLETIKVWMNSINSTISKKHPCANSYTPVCAYSKSPSQSCLEDVDEELTTRYLDTLRNIKPSLKKYCARLD